MARYTYPTALHSLQQVVPYITISSYLHHSFHALLIAARRHRHMLYGRDPWAIEASLDRGVIYLNFQSTPESVKGHQNRTSATRRFEFWGYSFERYATMTSLESLSKSGESAPGVSLVDTRPCHCVLARLRLNNHRMLIAGEVDCLRCRPPTNDAHSVTHPPEKTSMASLIELKTCRVLDSEKLRYNFVKYKALKFWAQSFLLVSSYLIVGFLCFVFALTTHVTYTTQHPDSEMDGSQ